MSQLVGRVVAVCTTAQVHPDSGLVGRTGIDKRPRDGGVAVDVTGLEGDVVCDLERHGGRDQAVYAYDEADAQRWGHELGRVVVPGELGENLTLTGVTVSDAVVGQRWQVGAQVVLEVTLPRTPCATFARWTGQPRWVRRFAERGDTGTYLRVITPGTVQAGDRVQVLHTPEHRVTVRQVFTGTDPAALARLLSEGVDLPPKAVAKAEQVLTRKGPWSPAPLSRPVATGTMGP